MKAYTPSQITSLIEHIREGKAIARHDLGHELADVLAFLGNRCDFSAPETVRQTLADEIELTP